MFVVLGHSFHEYPEGEMGHTMLLYRMMYSFRMPLFMFVSGFLMVFTTQFREVAPSWRRFAATKLRRLIVPFMVLSLVTFVPRVMMSRMADEPVEMGFSSFFISLFDGGQLVIPYFWFIQASFILLLVNYAILVMSRKARIDDRFSYLSLIVLFALLPLTSLMEVRWFSVFKAVEFGVFFITGAFYSRYASAIDRYVPWTAWWFVVMAVVVWTVSFFLTEGTGLRPLCSFAGIAMCISVAKLLEKYRVGILDHLIGANYIIFLLSWYFNVLAQQVLHHYVSLPWWIYTLLSVIAGIYVPWLFYRYMLDHPDGRVGWFGRHFLGQSLRRRV
ncbi:MAG: acyltransferase [Bacteroides sp.]|nr:acyltransferase [Bacteroides sp.]